MVYVTKSGTVLASRPTSLASVWHAVYTFIVLFFQTLIPKAPAKSSTQGGALERRKDVPKPKDHFKPKRQANVYGVDRFQPPPSACMKGGGG